MTLYQHKELRVDFNCLLCNRHCATAQGVKDQRAPIRPIHPEHAEAVRQMRCGYCGGRLMLGGALRILILHPLPLEVARPKRGRTPKRVADPTPRLCTDCMKRRAKYNRPRCETCAELRGRKRFGVHGRIMDTLLPGRLLRARDIAAMLGYSTSTVRKHIYLARRGGAPIESVGRAYRLNGGAA